VDESGNLYRYASANPMNSVDPKGLKDYPPQFVGPLLQEDTLGSEVPYVADTNDPRLDHLLNGGTAPDFYYPSGTKAELQMECVSLTKAFTGAPCTGCWRQGPIVYGNSNIAVGAAIAAGWDSNGRYPKGNVDKNSGLYAGQSASSVYIIDQYPEGVDGKPHKASVRPLSLTGGWPSNNGGAYYVITKARRCQCY